MALRKLGTSRGAILERGALQAWDVARYNSGRWLAAILERGTLQAWNVAAFLIK